MGGGKLSIHPSISQSRQGKREEKGNRKKEAALHPLGLLSFASFRFEEIVGVEEGRRRRTTG
jgi:hypothetical protein